MYKMRVGYSTLWWKMLSCWW